MPLPNVKKSEGEKEYVSRCMSFRGKEKDLTDEDERKRSLAMCFREYRDAKGIKESEPKSMLQILLENE